MDVEGAYLVRSAPRVDERGWFARIYDAQEFTANGLEPAIAQVNLAESVWAGTVRGLHYQLPPASEAKLVRCVVGSIFDVVVDNRPDSPTFGRWTGLELRASEPVAMYVPVGCAHGYQALTDGARALYHASTAYTPGTERGIHHSDPDIGVAWPLEPENVSDKDRQLPGLHEAQLPRA